MDEPPQLSPEDVAWVKKTREGQRAISLVLGWIKVISLWIGTVAGALVAIWTWHPWSKGGGP